jgi:tetratricopeptide (TPR) repeat protein
LSLNTGTRLGPYEILSPIGSGGMGEVYRACDTRLQRNVAIKILHADTSGDTWRRLLREARAAAALSHPSIVTIYSVEEVTNQCFIVMELVDGASLADRLARAPLDLSELCEIGAQISDALAAAHALGIVHHDVTPRNILLAPGGRAKLADFGLSRAVEPRNLALESTRTGPQIAGTVHYMSPEQARGEACTSGTDIFSLGSVLYYAATGRRPFEGGSPFAVMQAITTVEPPPPSGLRQGLPAAFDALLGRMMAKRLEDRTTDAGQAARALRTLAASVVVDGPCSVNARRDTPHDRVPFVGRARELALLAAALARASAGAGTTIVITGDAGAGKTSLVDAFLHAGETLFANPLVCRGQSIEHTGPGEAYFPLIDGLTPLVARESHGLHELVRTHAPSWRSQFPGAYSGEEIASTPPTPARLARELGDTLSAAARSRPVVLILEDLHWADPSTVELLRHLAYRAARAGLLIIGTCRTDEATAAGSLIDQVLAELEARGVCENVELSRLREDGIREYLERRFNLGKVAAPLASVLFKATEGHPLFLVSLVQLFVQRGDLRQVGDVWRLTTPSDRLHLGIPRTVEAVIRRKLATLDDADRRLLQYASVEGQEFSTAVLGPLVGTDPGQLEERLDVLTKGPRLITAAGPERFPDGTWGTRYQFAHAVYQKVVYDELTPSRKANLHRQIGERLTGLYVGGTTGIAAQLARHFKEGRDWGRAFGYFLQAGDNSMTLSAAGEAEAHYAQAVALANVEGTGVEPRGLAVALWKRATTRGFLGNAEGALTDFRDALIPASKAGDRDLMFDIRVNTIYAHCLGEQIDAALTVAANLEQDVEPPPGGLKRLRYLLAHLQLQIASGDLDRAASEADSAVALALSLGDSARLWHSLTVRAQVGYYWAEYTSAEKDLREVCSGAAARTPRLADPRLGNVHFHRSVFLGRVLGDLGHISEALAMLHSGLEIARADGYRFWVPRFLNAISTLYGEIGAVDAALQHDGGAAAEMVDQSSETRIEFRLNLITACLRLGRLDGAAGLLAETDTLTRANSWYHWLWRIRFAATAAEDALTRGAFARATELAQEGNALARRYRLWKYVVITERLLAEAAAEEGGWSRAAAHVQQALDVLTVHPVPIVAWKVHATAARVHRYCGRRAEEAAECDRARGEVRQMSERIHEEQLKTAFLESHDARQVFSDPRRD